MTGVWLKRRSAWGQQQDDARDDLDVDDARVVHSGSFQRLQGKTQILNLGDSDFYRTRLTHSLEVAQIAGGLSRQLSKTYPDHQAVDHLPPLSLIQTSGFCHDLGHPPFGHGGEVALNYCMRSAGGFEGNGQTLRILSRLESFSSEHGADLTRRSLLAILKYPVPFSKVSNADIKPALDERATSIRTLDRSSCKPPKCFRRTFFARVAKGSMNVIKIAISARNAAASLLSIAQAARRRTLKTAIKNVAS